MAVLLLLGAAAPASSETPVPTISPRWFSELWTAHWITHPKASRNGYGVTTFRRHIVLREKPAHYVVHISADARYRLFVNGESVCFGPQRSDALVWHYETIDLAPWLKTGSNMISAQVVSYGEWAPLAITNVRTGFLLQGDGEAERDIDTGREWKVSMDGSHSPIPIDLPTYIVVGAGTRIDGRSHPWGWKSVDFDDSGWSSPRLLARGMPHGMGTDIEHWLKPRTIPLMEETPHRTLFVRRAEGNEVPAGFPDGKAVLQVPAYGSVRLLLDNRVETKAFPHVVVSGGLGGLIRMTYAEALIDATGQKGDRNAIENRSMRGVVDEIVPDGGEGRVFAPYDFRTYRYVQLEATAGAQPLRIEDIYGVATGYPFKLRATFSGDDVRLAKIWETGWRTAQLCAFETYMDTPYYEQLQYVADTRIQALITLYASGDDRLMRNAIEQYDRSRIAEGLTQSRFPSSTPQVINTFSLFWIDMVHDFWMHRRDDAFVEGRLAGIRCVLDWFERRIDPKTGLLGPLSYWTFVDWTKEWPWDEARGTGGQPSGAVEGGSSIVTLQLVGTLGRAAELFRAYGQAELSAKARMLAAKLKTAVLASCWSKERRLFADTPGGVHFSQHANTFAVLAKAVEGEEARSLIRRTAADPSLIQCSAYFRFYLLRAMKEAGLADEYLTQLGPWEKMLDLGLTTFAETPDPTRSDCHAWSASPVYEFLATVAGIEPAAPGFDRVRIAPHLGQLRNVSASIPHPLGEIRVRFKREGKVLQASIHLPKDLEGEFVWAGHRLSLRSGDQELNLTAP